MIRPDITLYFVRHGQTDWNAEQRYQGQTDTPLNDTGRAQAARNGKALADILGAARDRFAFVSSPLERATETMEIIRAGMGLAPRPFPTEPRLKEQNFGHWEGLTWTELPALDPEGFAARLADTWGWKPRGGENYEDVRARVLPWLEQLDRDTIAVSHGNISRTVRGIVLGLDTKVIPKLEVPQDRVLRIRGGNAEWL